MGPGYYYAAMDQPVRRNIVVSAVNLRKGGTLTVLRDCLLYLSSREDLHVTALVHKRELSDYPGIDYIEIPWSIKGWGRRLWCEYVTMHRLSKKLPDTDLWLSLHDTTPRVRARRQAVYCHTAFPFMKATRQDWKMDKKIVLFSLFTRFAYKINVRRNRYLIVQQDWMRSALSGLLSFPKDQIIVSRPSFLLPPVQNTDSALPLFLYPGTPDCHKNFETLCEAARLLEERVGKDRFQVVITIKGDENRYARYLKENWGAVASLDFRGLMPRYELAGVYGEASCLVFPSRCETWGLPISEFLPTGKPMLLADLPYARETAAGAGHVRFFPATNALALAAAMQAVVEGQTDFFNPVEPAKPAPPLAPDWESLVALLLN